jgi:hypothetical protein
MIARLHAALDRREAVEETPMSSDVPVAASAPSRRTRLRSHLSGSLLALVAFVYVLGVAALTLMLGGVVLHAISPTRTFDIFYALHQQYVVGILLGLAIFWVLPPHPWVKQPEDEQDQEPAQHAGETGVGDRSNVTDLSDYRGREPSRRPGGRGEVAG